MSSVDGYEITYINQVGIKIDNPVPIIEFDCTKMSKEEIDILIKCLKELYEEIDFG